MAYRRKWRPGAPIRELLTLITAIESGLMIYLGNKVYSPGWMLGMPLGTLRNYVNRGLARWALPAIHHQEDEDGK